MTTTPPWTRSARLLDRAIERVAEAGQLDPVAEQVAASVQSVFGGDVAASTLSGTVTGHPLHPPLTDISMGLLLSATLLDVVVPGDTADRATTTLLSAGLLAAVPTAMTGLRDWSDTSGETRRVGLAHGATNAVATMLYALSLVMRLRGGRVLPRVCSGLGFLVLLVGGLLGGDLAYRRGVGVDHTTFQAGPADWTEAALLDEVPMGELHAVEIDGVDVALFRTPEGVFAVADRCSHLGGPLSEGHVHEETMEIGCPWHHSMFRLSDGCVTRGPATAPQPNYQTRVVDGVVELRARD